MSVPSDEGDYWDIQREARDWIRLGVYMRMWPNAKKLDDVRRRQQLTEMRSFAASTSPENRCGCNRPGWKGVRNAFWAHWPSCPLFSHQDDGGRSGEGSNPWLLPLEE